MLPSLQEFKASAVQGKISEHRYYNMVGYKYTTNTVYSEDWDNVSLHARGIVFDDITGKVLARPFDKFFNLGEMMDMETGELKDLAMDVKEHLGFDNLSGDYKHQKFRVMDKLDGSLGILFWTGTHWYVKTAGSFESDQAKWANAWFAKNIDQTHLDQSKTYLFEIIYDEDKHPIEYDFQGMVLLGIITTETGIEEPLSEILRVADELHVRHADVIELNDFDEVVEYAKNLPKTKEGVVITFENGFKLKVKGDEFLQLQRIFHYLTKDVIYENFNYLKSGTDKDLRDVYTEGFIENIPEECVEMKQYAKELYENFETDVLRVYTAGSILRSSYNKRKDAYEAAVKDAETGILTRKSLIAAIMLYYTAGKINEKILFSIYKQLKP